MKNLKIKTILSAFALLMTLAGPSCTSIKNYYQVYEVKSENVPLVGENYVFNNDELTVRYDFCKRGGDITFYCYNKTDKIVYLLLDKSFYIHNGIAYDYYKDCDYTVSATSTSGSQASASAIKSVSAGVSKTAYGRINLTSYPGSVGISANAAVSRVSEIGYYNSKSTTESVTSHAPKIIAIPPKCAKYIDGFTIQNDPILRCGKDMYEQNYPKRSSSVFSYTKEDSPILFSNHVSYSFSQSGENMMSFVNNFYVSSIQNKAESLVFEKNPDYEAGHQIGFRESKDACSSNAAQVFTIYSPTCFYNKFEKQ